MNKAILDSPLTQTLMALVGATGPTGAAISAIATAAHAITGIVADAMSDNTDDPVALFDGTYAPEHTSDTEEYDQRGASITLDLRVEP